MNNNNEKSIPSEAQRNLGIAQKRICRVVIKTLDSAGSVNTKLYKCLKRICSGAENYDLKVKPGLGMVAKSPEARNE